MASDARTGRDDQAEIDAVSRCWVDVNQLGHGSALVKVGCELNNYRDCSRHRRDVNKIPSCGPVSAARLYSAACRPTSLHRPNSRLKAALASSSRIRLTGSGD